MKLVRILLIAAFMVLASEAVDGNAVVFDEFAHVPAGIIHWESGRFSIYRENPPLVRALVSLPAWLSGARMDYSRAGVARRSEWQIGWDFVRANGARHRELYRRSRLVAVALAIACGLLVARWAGRIYGSAAAPVICMALWLLDPNVLAHASLATTDAGTAAFGFLAAYVWWRVLSGQGSFRARSAGFALGLAQASKFSMLVLYPSWLVLAIAARRKKSEGSAPRPREVGAVFLVSLLTLNAIYRFDGLFTPLGGYEFHSALLGGAGANRFRGTVLAGLPVPLPRDYVLGFDSQKWDEEIGLANLSGGRLTLGGRWYSPLATLARKMPPGTLILSVIAAALFASGRWPRLTALALWVPPLAIIALLCSQTGLNWPVRYALPALPYLAVAAGGAVDALWNKPWGRCLVAACLAWNGCELIENQPGYLSYGNLLAGGTTGAQRLFLGSNYDWGQDLFRLKRWAEEHPQARPLCVSYFGVLDPAATGLGARGLPRRFLATGAEGASRGSDAPCAPFYWAVSSNYLNGLPGWFRLDDGSTVHAALRPSSLRREQAVARIGSTIFIFVVSPPRTDAPALPGRGEAERRIYLDERVPGPLSSTP